MKFVFLHATLLLWHTTLSNKALSLLFLKLIKECKDVFKVQVFDCIEMTLRF